ncbi:Na+/H+ antiporter subunit E [Agromyces sp. C10]|uniref:Na+/H+ antiporter subunit E n=1 Tax=Agromyces sp. C10 TaxID=2935077 RepID=UPI00200A2359|nr:Na+/H+ antiporter subunit E [Agromyces sp. C10]MCK8610650.1 Na+/H+ antiporter subunit E [Agromyces sp. C10]
MTTNVAGERGTHEPDEFSRWEAVWRQAPLLLGLVVLWVFLWDHVDVLTVVTGLALAIAVTRALYLPPVLLSGRFNLWRGLLLGLRMMFDVVIASIQVALKAVWPTWQPMNSIVDVQLLTRSDLVTTLTAEAISVVPGTVVMDIDRERGLLYLHALGTRTAADIGRTRERVLATEERIVLAIGTRAQARAVHEARRRRKAGETGRISPGLARALAPSETAERHPLAEHDAATELRGDGDGHGRARSRDEPDRRDTDDRNGGTR